MSEEFKIPTGVTTWVPGTNLRACLEECMFIWMNECKQEVNDFAYDIRRKRDGLHKDNGMSREGNLREYLEVPPKLHALITHWTNKDWMLDRQICGMIQQLIPDLMPYKGKDGSKIVVDKVII